MKSVEDKVIIVTGAGRGIGREIALLAGREGGKVVVNDLGGDTTGEGKDVSIAEIVAEEIRAAGGDAISNGDSVAEASGVERIYEQALDTYGRVDCVINNAGILRDRMIFNMSFEEWDAVMKVHLYGCFLMTRRAAPMFREQKSGSFVHFTSTAGVMGSSGHSNYVAAKAGIMGFSKGVALDLAKYNVRSNCIAPFAWSRLVGTVPNRTPEEAARRARSQQIQTADKIAALPVFLAGDASREVSGQVFGVRGNEIYLISQPRVLRSVHNSNGWTPDSIAKVALPAMRPSFYENVNMMELFGWESI